MSADAHSVLTDKSYLTGVQYQTGANLAARQSIYAFQQPKIDLVASVLGLARLAGTETVADIGCGNGVYLAGLTRRGHAGRVLGIDLSPGMLAATRAAVPGASLAIGDAAALPLADGTADVTLAPHMLYHVPDPRAAVAELRRVTRPGGQLLVVLNGNDHLAELRELTVAAAAAAGEPVTGIIADYEASFLVLTLDAGAELLAEAFSSVQRHDFAAELLLPDAEPVAGYVASLRAHGMPDPAGFTQAVCARIPFGPDGRFRVRTHCGLLICS
ncbi:MAG TPA: class I SAM-dependent methyltransferase [Streptosporangiaceae bacterium]|nr:class I SAM-dependent methyltransferase [Streptosporangiaceae bacterium]